MIAGGRALRPFGAMAGSVLGAAAQLQQAQLWAAPRYVLLTGLGLLGLLLLTRWRHASRGLWLVSLLCAALAGAGLAGWRAAAYASDALSPELEGRDLQLVGVVAQMPQRNEAGLRFRLEVESARWADGSRSGAVPQLPARIALGWYAANTGLWGRADGSGNADAARPPGPLHAGERWRMTVRLKAPHGNLNPHGFDYELWLWEQGLQATGYVRTGQQSGAKGDAWPERIGSTWRHPIERSREAVRDAIFERVADHGPAGEGRKNARSAGVLAALVTGDQSAIERADWDVFRATGVAHLMSISGLHVTMFAWLAALAIGALWRRSARLTLRWPAPHAALVGGLALAVAYALFSGWGVPAQRTVWMLATAALLRLAGRRWPWPHVWLTACAVVVALDPWALMQPGFWLSFVAVGVLFATNSIAAPVGRTGVASRFAKILREQWVVTLALAPLSLLLFQQLSLVGLVANALAIPWVTLVITPLAMLGAALPPLWNVAAWAVQGLGVLLQWLAGLPLATLSTPAPPLWMAMVGVAGGLLLAMRWPWTLRVLGLPLLLPVLLWQAPRPAPGEFELLAADIGQGNAVLVRTAHHSLLYDTGPRYSLESDAGHRVLVPLLRAGGERLTSVMLSHRDSDHVGGAPAVLAMQPQAALLSSIEADHPLQAQRAAQRCLAGQRWEWDGVVFEVLHPVEADYTNGAKANDLSCVLRIANGRAAALLTGDIERVQEAALVARSPQLRADLLLVPHHGSKTSSSPPLLDAVQPRIALVQAGYRNRFGHPAAEVLARYRERGITVIDSPRCGAARWSSAAPGEVQCQRQAARRYWHHAMP